MVQKEEIEINNNNILDNIAEENTTSDNNTLSMEKLIDKISLLSKNENPYLVSKEIEEIKSIFYIKLKIVENEKVASEKTGDTKEEKIKELHPIEIRFKSVFNTYRRIKSDFRKNKEREEEKNLKIKQSIIKEIDALSKEQESIKTTFEKFRSLQEIAELSCNLFITSLILLLEIFLWAETPSIILSEIEFNNFSICSLFSLLISLYI